MMNKALLKAIAACDTQAELARRISASTAQVDQWKRGERPIPAMRCEEIEIASGRAVTCEELRPDVEWTRDENGRAFYRESRVTRSEPSSEAA